MLGARVKTLGHKMAGLFKSPQRMYTLKKFHVETMEMKDCVFLWEKFFPS